MAKKDKNEKRSEPDEEYGDIYELEIPTGGDPFKEIIFRHMQNIMKLSCVEFRGGYWTTITDKKGGEKEVYIPDTREIYCNAVFAWCLTLQGKFTKKMKENYKKFKDKKVKLEKEFMEESSIDETVILGEAYYNNEKDKLLLETYKQKKLNVHLFLFAKLNLFMKEENYFNVSGGTFQG